MLNGLALMAQAKIITRPFLYPEGPDMREGVKSLLHAYMPDLEVRFDGEPIPGEFEVPDGITLFDFCEDAFEVLDIVVEWWTDAVVVRAAGSGGGLAGLVKA